MHDHRIDCESLEGLLVGWLVGLRAEIGQLVAWREMEVEAKVVNRSPVSTILTALVAIMMRTAPNVDNIVYDGYLWRIYM